mmetsp:Transcript_43246/g.138949  ORF Transcript_43246/g.138949 Transcript_43246/m.138949 type:complete len:130 (-) Transcript_43246:31-420(-)
MQLHQPFSFKKTELCYRCLGLLQWRFFLLYSLSTSMCPAHKETVVPALFKVVALASSTFVQRGHINVPVRWEMRSGQATSMLCFSQCELKVASHHHGHRIAGLAYEGMRLFCDACKLRWIVKISSQDEI